MAVVELAVAVVAVTDSLQFLSIFSPIRSLQTMKPHSTLQVRAKRFCSKCAPVVLVLQKTPVSQLFVQEARVLGTTGLTSVVKWSVATVAGLGAFDSVTGATTLTQISPSRGSSTVSATVGEVLSFIVQVTGAPSTAGSWQVIGTLPAGLKHQNATNSNTDSINGVPAQSGTFPITVKAWENKNFRGGSKSKTFTINVAGGEPPPAVTTQPVSSEVNSNGTVTLSVGVTGTSPAFQWYVGASGDTSNPVSGATGASFTTPALSATTSYWVSVTNSSGFVDSTTATVTVTVAPTDPFVSWQEGNFDAAQLADPLISGATANPDGDAQTNEEEYIFGTLPLVAEAPVAPAISLDSGEVSISFTASLASGPGYSGMKRHYALESAVASELAAGNWTMVPDFDDIIANDQVVTLKAPAAGESTCYRMRVWLAPGI